MTQGTGWRDRLDHFGLIFTLTYGGEAHLIGSYLDTETTSLSAHHMVAPLESPAAMENSKTSSLELSTLRAAVLFRIGSGQSNS